MKKDSLTFGAKINCTFATIAAVLALAVWFGFQTAGSLSDSLESATGKTLRRIELAGILNTAESDMAVGQRGVVMFTYAKDSGQTTSAKQLFRTSSETFRKALVEIGPLLVLESTDIGGLASHAAKLVPSVLDTSSLSRMNFTRIEGLAALARNSGRVLRRAMATTCSEGASPGRTVRIHEPKDCQTSVGFVAERI